MKFVLKPKLLIAWPLCVVGPGLTPGCNVPVVH